MDDPVTKKELSGWARVAATVIPIMVTVLGTTWALGARSEAADTKIQAIIEKQAAQDALLAKHATIIDRVPQLERSLDLVSTQLRETEKAVRRLNDTLIRVETLLSIPPRPSASKDGEK